MDLSCFPYIPLHQTKEHRASESRAIRRAVTHAAGVASRQCPARQPLSLYRASKVITSNVPGQLWSARRARPWSYRAE